MQNLSKKPFPNWGPYLRKTDLLTVLHGTIYSTVEHPVAPCFRISTRQEMQKRPGMGRFSIIMDDDAYFCTLTSIVILLVPCSPVMFLTWTSAFLPVTVSQ